MLYTYIAYYIRAADGPLQFCINLFNKHIWNSA